MALQTLLNAAAVKTRRTFMADRDRALQDDSETLRGLLREALGWLLLLNGEPVVNMWSDGVARTDLITRIKEVES